MCWRGIAARSAGSLTERPTRLHPEPPSAAFLVEPYITQAGEQYGDPGPADLDQGSAPNFPAAVEQDTLVTPMVAPAP